MLPFQIAYRFLRSSLGQTLLIILGISVGVSVQVFIGSLIGGLQESLVDTTIGNSSQITITSEDGYISEYLDIESNIDNEQISVISFSLDSPGTLIDGTTTNPILLRGFDLDKAEGIYQFQDKLVDGNMPTNDNQVIIGKQLQEELDLSIGETVTIQVPLVGDSEVTISGVYDFNVSQINSLWLISNLQTAQTVADTEDVVSAIEMQVKDVFEAETVAGEIESGLPGDLEISNWIENNGELLSGLTAQSSSSLMIQVFVTISVVLGITSVLAITVIQKSRQIGILKAMGIKDKTASLIFLAQGFLLGIFGAIGGVLLGLLLSFAFTNFAVNDLGDPVVPLLIDPQFIMISALVAIFSASIASIIPARRSSKLSVIEVIKNG
jgi:lipoprotein-releasing system permease protein